jgi:hypothetical protein
MIKNDILKIMNSVVNSDLFISFSLALPVLWLWFIRFAFKKKNLPRSIPVVMNPWRPSSTNCSTKQDLHISGDQY